MDVIFSIIILIVSVIIHEVAHGYAAEMQGDPTARLAGRLTLNPISHIDPIGSVIIPLITFLSGGFIVGWAKPVPYNPYNLRNQRWGELIVAIAGPLSNITLALIFGLFMRLLPTAALVAPIGLIVGTIVIINLSLAFFNLMPIPPLDGSKVLFALIPARFTQFRAFLERYSLILVLIFILFAAQWIVGPLVSIFFQLITGIHF